MTGSHCSPYEQRVPHNCAGDANWVRPGSGPGHLLQRKFRHGAGPLPFDGVSVHCRRCLAVLKAAGWHSLASIAYRLRFCLTICRCAPSRCSRCRAS